jgi:hypothetical protein
MRRSLANRVAAFALASAVFVSCGTLRVTAQEVPAQRSPDPAACTIEPRTLEEIGALWDGTPVTEWEQARESVTIPIGSDVSDTATRDAVTATIEGVFACLNASDMDRAFAYMTDEAIVANFGWAVQGIALNEDWVTQMEPMPAEMRMTILALGPIMRLPDGRVGALVTFHDPSTEAEMKIAALYLVLVLQGPIWQIAEVYPIQE